MAEEDISEENRQFEQVLNRLDSLMKRNHLQVKEEAPGMDVAGVGAVTDIPVLTEIYYGETTLPSVAIAEQETLPLLTELALAALPVVEQAAVEKEQLPVLEFLPQPQLSCEQEVESMVAELMPKLRETMSKLVQEELLHVQQHLSLRMSEEAENLLSRLLLEAVKPK
ncbi:hypothetical protein GALL_318320 [mine drainage metagenome]|uniref:Uncharacterized protein n=1 Tax=mine drainage metagenome TaxID=410659 RepID=A0A1J5QSA9_9ZZZZ